MSVALPALTMAGAKAGAAQGIQWGLDDLLQELLMALVGYTGDIFVDNSNDDPRYPPVRLALLIILQAACLMPECHQAPTRSITQPLVYVPSLCLQLHRGGFP